MESIKRESFSIYHDFLINTKPSKVFQGISVKNAQSFNVGITMTNKKPHLITNDKSNLLGL